MPRKKSASGLGGVRQKTVNGRTYYEARYTDPATHKQHSIGAKTEKECAEKLRAIYAKIHTGQRTAPQKITVAEWLNEWLDARINIQASTRAAYASIIRTHISPVIGNVRLQALRKTDCQKVVRRLQETPNKDGGAHSHHTINNVVTVLGKAMRDAVEADILTKSPAQGLEVPHGDRKPPTSLDTTEQAKFLHATDSVRYGNVLKTLLYTGARISEVLGLKWENVDFSAGTIFIEGQLDRMAKQDAPQKIKRTKTNRTRLLYVPRFFLDILRDEKERQNANKELHRHDWHDTDGLVFTQKNGKPILYQSIIKSGKECFSAIGRTELTLHALRHTFITEEMRSGTDPRTVADIVGHVNVATTLNIYADSTAEMKRAAAERRQREWEAMNE